MPKNCVFASACSVRVAARLTPNPGTEFGLPGQPSPQSVPFAKGWYPNATAGFRNKADGLFHDRREIPRPGRVGAKIPKCWGRGRWHSLLR